MIYDWVLTHIPDCEQPSKAIIILENVNKVRKSLLFADNSLGSRQAYYFAGDRYRIKKYNPMSLRSIRRVLAFLVKIGIVIRTSHATYCRHPNWVDAYRRHKIQHYMEN